MTAQQPIYLNVAQAAEKIRSLGLNVTERQVRRWAEKRVLPFFLFQKALMIDQNELVMHFQRLQLAAVRENNKLHGRKAA